MDIEVLNLMDRRFDDFKDLFKKQNELVSSQISTMTKNGDNMNLTVESIRLKLETLVAAEESHYSKCPVNERLETLKAEFNKVLDEIEDQVKEVRWVVKFKKLLYTIQFIVEWKVISIPVFVAVCCLSVVGGVKSYETGKQYFMEWIATKEQVEKNTKFIYKEEQKEVKSMLKSEPK